MSGKDDRVKRNSRSMTNTLPSSIARRRYAKDEIRTVIIDVVFDENVSTTQRQYMKDDVVFDEEGDKP